MLKFEEPRVVELVPWEKNVSDTVHSMLSRDVGAYEVLGKIIFIVVWDTMICNRRLDSLIYFYLAYRLAFVGGIIPWL